MMECMPVKFRYAGKRNRRSVRNRGSRKKRFALLLAIAAVAAFFALAHRGYAQQQSPHADAAPQSPHADNTAPQPPARPLHTITVRFNYDFNRTPPCSAATAGKLCVQQFVVYDVSLGPL